MRVSHKVDDKRAINRRTDKRVEYLNEIKAVNVQYNQVSYSDFYVHSDYTFTSLGVAPPSTDYPSASSKRCWSCQVDFVLSRILHFKPSSLYNKGGFSLRLASSVLLASFELDNLNARTCPSVRELISTGHL